MITDILKARFFQGYRTGKFPLSAPPNLPAHFQGRPVLSKDADVSEAEAICPVGAIQADAKGASLDLGKCIFCGKCGETCPKAISFTQEYRMGAMKRERLIVRPGGDYTPDEQLERGIRRMYGKSLKIRQVSAGGCAACELDFNVLHTLAWDMGRFGIQAVASPRHADCVLVTGPVSQNMKLALQKTYEAMPKPCLVIASGACAISGGLYADSDETAENGVSSILPVDLFVPGCPPHPAVLLEALLRFIGRL